MTTLRDSGSVLGWPLDIFLGLSQFHGHGSWFMCEVALRNVRNVPSWFFPMIVLQTLCMTLTQIS